MTGRLRQAEPLRTFSELSRLMTTAADPTEILHAVAEAGVRLFDAATARVWVADPVARLLRTEASAGIDPVVERLMTDFPVIRYGEGLVGRILEAGAAAYLPDIAADPRWLNRRLVIEGGLKACAGVPLALGEEALGVLVILFRERREFSDEERELLQLLGDQAAICLKNARLYRQTREAYEALSRTQAQLTQAQKMEVVGQLAAGIAHDFNNLLAVILGRSMVLQLALEHEPGLLADLELIDKTVGRAAALTRQLLAFTRQQVLQPVVLDMNGVVSRTIELLRRSLGKDIVIETLLEPGLGHVLVDPVQLEQVLMNLAVNARDAMPDGGRLLFRTANLELDDAFVRQHPGSRVGQHVILAVSDTGHGIPPDVQPRVFEPFFTTKGRDRGTGLGLSTIYGIVKQSHGYIGLESAVGRGTTFTVYLPRVDEAAVRQADGRGPAGTVVVVDDDPAFRSLAREILTEAGYTVLEAADGDAAVKLCSAPEGPIDLLLTDVIMPKMNGIELAQRVLALRPGMKVIYMSGYAQSALVQRLTQESGAAVLPKPFSVEALTSRVQESLGAVVTR